MQTSYPDRKALREALIRAREALPPAEHAAREANLLARLQALLETRSERTLGFCWPHRREADVRSAVLHWLAGASERQAALPVVVARQQPLQFRAWSADAEMVQGDYDIPIPASGPWLQPQILLIPLNGFDARGYRLGYGGGYFDRTLAELQPAPVTIGYGFELGRLTRIDENEFDQPLDWIVTEQACMRIA
ncbi:5-formyltetrahydrofolate cyclo-ligase [Uliginosibacterium sediminicola]|uniref:5-formyltetrahydrofolate cyclo-ligase n=1 Tax=Uliginosibacterium sediminicola TaxID=2024550 RepID=A0ABU9YU54_9RHOO